MAATDHMPGILQYIPFFYVIWSDDLLSASEVSVVKHHISQDGSLITEERKKLLSWLDRNDPPSNQEIKGWKKLITDSGIQLVESVTYPLTTFSLKLAGHYNGGSDHNEQLVAIESNLGIQPNHYNHLFEVQVIQQASSNYYKPEVLDRLLLGESKETAIDIRKFLAEPIFRWEIQTDLKSKRLRVLDQLKVLASKGYGAMAYDKAYGGKRALPGYAAVFEHLVFADGSLAVKFGVQFGLFGGSIQSLGTKKHWDKYLEDTGKAKLLGCFAMTETRHGSNVRDLKTTATYDPKTDSLIVHTPGENDSKEYIGNALHSSMASVFAQLIVNGKNEGVHAVLVPLRNDNGHLLKGVTVEDNGFKMGLNGVDNGKIWFNQVRVPRENLLDKYGEIRADGTYHSTIQNPNKRFFTMLGTLVGGRICVAQGALGGAKMALSIAVKYALKRRQFNDNVKVQEDLIMDYPSHQLRLIPALAKAYVFDVTLKDIINDFHKASGSETREIETQVAGLKALITWYANETIQECREACGGKGYLVENRISDLRADLDIFTTFEGDNTVLLQLASKGVLSDFRSEFNNTGFISVLRFLSSQWGDKLSAINPIYTNKVDKDHLFSTKFHKHALHYRRRRLTYTLGMRIRNYIRKGVPSYQAFLKVQTHLLKLGYAYAEELAYDKFCDFTEKIKKDKYRSLFERLGTLYALSVIREDASWYLEQGYLGSVKSKAIRQRVERLCSELRPHVLSLVDGFGIPDHLDTAPITR